MPTHHRLLVLSLLAALAVPAGAVAAPSVPEVGSAPALTLEAPEPGSVLTGAVAVSVVGGFDVAGVEVRVRRAEDVLWGPEGIDDPVDSGGVRRWENVVDLTRLPNGPARLEVRATPPEADGDDAGWAHHWVVLDAPPPRPQIAVSAGSRPGAVDVAWTPVGITDVTDARVERAGPGATAFTSAVPLEPGELIDGGSRALDDLAAGEHRLRLTVERPGGLGGVRVTSSAVAVVPVRAPAAIPRLPDGGGATSVPRLPEPRVGEVEVRQPTPEPEHARDRVVARRSDRRRASAPSLRTITGEAGYPDEAGGPSGERAAVPPAVAAEPEVADPNPTVRTRPPALSTAEDLAAPGTAPEEPGGQTDVVSLLALLLVIGMVRRWGRLRHR